MELLNMIGTDARVPTEIRFNWGDAIPASNSIKTAVHKIGVRGSKLQHCSKE